MRIIVAPPKGCKNELAVEKLSIGRIKTFARLPIADRDIQNSCSGGADRLSRLKCWNVFRQSVLVSFVCLVSLILNSIYLFSWYI